MSAHRPLQPPSGGMLPPPTVTLADGTQLDLRPLARKISEAHFARHPDELQHYGEAGLEWCTHDNQHLLQWAALDLTGSIDFDEQLRWLTRVLTARGYPIENLADNLRAGESVLKGQSNRESVHALAERLAVAAESLSA